MTMKKIDKAGLLLCELQATTFEKSVDKVETSSGIFIRRFMYSNMAKMLDNNSILQTNLQAQDLIDSIEEEYGESKYGSIKYTHNEIHWVGYVYRYLSYTYDLSSVQVYKLIKPKELRRLYLPYHTMDPAQAIERILEAKGRLPNEEQEIKRQFEIYKKIRNEN